MAQPTHIASDKQIFVPQFANAFSDSTTGQGKLVAARVQPHDVDVPFCANAIDAQRPVFSVRRLDNGECIFTLRSRLNARLLFGTSLSAQEELETWAGELSRLCTDENQLPIRAQSDGYRIELVDLEGNVLGYTASLASESLARAMQKLIAIQARQARLDLH